MGDDDVERVGGAALKEADQHLAAPGAGELHAECRPPEEARAQAHRDERESARFHEHAAIHAISYRR